MTEATRHRRTLVLGGTGSAGRRLVQRLTRQHVGVRGRPPFRVEAVASRVHELAGKRGDAKFEVVDLTDFALPPLDEPMPAITGHYTRPHTRSWAAKIIYAEWTTLLDQVIAWGAALKALHRGERYGA